MEKITTVGELIAKLQEFRDDLPVTISDGYNMTFYAGKYDVTLWDGFDCELDTGSKAVCDIGIGGTNELHEFD